MKADNLIKQRSERVWLTAQSCTLDDFVRHISRVTEPADYPQASAILSNVPIYDGDSVRNAAGDHETRKALMAEWAEAMLGGPGIVVIKRAFADLAVVDAATSEFFALIAEQNAAGQAAGDHFAKPGANDRCWNVIEKLALRAPEVFANYYASDAIAMAAQAWLGSGYQITSQLNVVNPGGEAQSVHRDYHMGFQSVAEIENYPVHAHLLSPVMTLQGAVAHVDMPLASGPTLYLPYSQSFTPGYFAWRRPEFKDYFKQHHVQLPLAKGDAVFFNPALFHAAGANVTNDIRRIANLLQISSAYGRSIEAVNRQRMVIALYPVLRRLKAGGQLDRQGLANAIAAAAEGYPFPTNLDRDPPLGGLAPPSQAQLMHQALAEDWKTTVFAEAIGSHDWRHLA